MRDPRIAPDVLAYIRAMGFSARSVDEDTIEVSPREDVPDQQARRELDLYLSLWRVVEERYDVTLLPERAPPQDGSDGGEAPHPSPPSSPPLAHDFFSHPPRELNG